LIAEWMKAAGSHDSLAIQTPFTPDSFALQGRSPRATGVRGRLDPLLGPPRRESAFAILAGDESRA
jgi:hypothetical protein